jgi:hypothetical protein
MLSYRRITHRLFLLLQSIAFFKVREQVFLLLQVSRPCFPIAGSLTGSSSFFRAWPSSRWENRSSYYSRWAMLSYCRITHRLFLLLQSIAFFKARKGVAKIKQNFGASIQWSLPEMSLLFVLLTWILGSWVSMVPVEPLRDCPVIVVGHTAFLCSSIILQF